VFTSAVMFSLRFCADFIEKKVGLSPVGILVVCATLACCGLLLTSYVNTFLFALVALGVYAVGKTFFWPTMLAVASDRFPRAGAVAISIMGGIGMMSAGLIGAPGLGYAKDRFAGEALREEKPGLVDRQKAAQEKLAADRARLEKEGAPDAQAKALEERSPEERGALGVFADKPSAFLFFAPSTGLGGKNLGDIQKKLTKDREALVKEGKDPQAALDNLTPEQKAVFQASVEGDRRTLRADAVI